MIILFRNLATEIQSQSDLNNYWESINRTLKEDEEVITFLELNGMQYTSDFEKIILRKLESNHEEVTVSISSQKYMDLTMETIANLQSYLVNLLKVTEQVANPFYLEPSEKDWELFQSFLDGMSWVLQAVEVLINSKYNKLNNFELTACKNDFDLQLLNLLNAMEEKNYILVADLILYEIDPNINKLLKIIEGEIEVGIL